VTGVRIPGAKRWKAKRKARQEQERRLDELRAEWELRRQIEQEHAAGGGDHRPRGGLVSVLRRALFRGRRLLAPLVWLIVLALLGVVGAGVGYALVWLVVVAGWWLVRGRRRVDRVAERAYAAVCVTAVTGWLLGGDLGGWRWLVVGWAVLATPWWLHHWPRPRPPDPEPVQRPVDPVVQAWNDNIAAAGRAVAGSELYAPERTEHGRQWAIQTVPGQPGHTLGEILGKIPQISHGLREAQELVMIDKHPGTPDPTVYRLQVIEDSPIVRPVIYQGPRWEGGNILMGPHADGIGAALWRIYSQDSMWGGFLLGGTGSGKSRLTELLAIAVRAMSAAGMPTTILYLDGQAGASSPLLWKHATWRGGPAQANDLLCALERGLAMRQKWNVINGQEGFTPGRSPDGVTPGLPGVLVIIDEQHRIFTPQNGLRWANVARESRKAGMGVLGSDQYSDLEAFGGKDPLRAALLAGNGVVMRTLSNTAGDLIPGVALDPSTFPDMPGYGFKIPGTQSTERLAPFRGEYLPSVKDDVQYEDVLTREEWFERTADAELDEMTARAFGPLFTDRHRLAEEALRRAQAEVEGRELVDLTKRDRPSRVPLVSVPDVDDGNVDQEILRLLTGGPKERAELIAASRRSESSVKQGLTRLHRAGQIRRLRQGTYERVADAVPAA
jgi:hypothetical protein